MVVKLIVKQMNQLENQKLLLDYSKTMRGVHLVSRFIIPYNSQRLDVKWYQKLPELFIELSVYNSFIIFRKLYPENNPITHLLFR